MKTKSTFLARKALASPTVVARQPNWRRVATVSLANARQWRQSHLNNRVDAGQAFPFYAETAPIEAHADWCGMSKSVLI